MYDPSFGRYAHRAAARIPLFILAYTQHSSPPYTQPRHSMNAIEKQNKSSSGVQITIPFADIFRPSMAYYPTALRRAPGPTTPAVAYALNDVAQQRNASSNPSRKQIFFCTAFISIRRILNRLSGRQHREQLAKMHNNKQHRPRLHHHHQNRQIDDLEINFNWNTKND